MNISGARVTLRGLVPNAAYDVAVAAINSNHGVSSNFSAMAQFTVSPTAAAGLSKLLFPSTAIEKFAFAKIAFILGMLYGLDRINSYFIAYS